MVAISLSNNCLKKDDINFFIEITKISQAYFYQAEHLSKDDV